LAFAAASSGVGIDDAITALESGVKLKPNEASLMIDLASLYMRKDRFDEAGELAKKAYALTDDASIRSRAQSINSSVQMRRAAKVGSITLGGPVGTGRSSAAPELTQEQKEKVQMQFKHQLVNKEIGPLKPGLERVVGKITKISCPSGTVRYLVQAGGEAFTLTSVDFQGLGLMVYGGEAGRSEEHTSELQSRENLVCRLLLEKKKIGVFLA